MESCIIGLFMVMQGNIMQVTNCSPSALLTKSAFLLFIVVPPAVWGGDAALPDLKRMPRRLDSWKAEDAVPPAPELLAAIGADAIITCIYHDLENRNILISSHLAVFSNWDEGIYHHPLTAYRSSGWTLQRRTEEPVSTSDGRQIQVSMSDWEKESDHIAVLFWYQVDDQIVLDRSALADVRLRLKDGETLPGLIKVQLQITESRPGDGKDALKRLASSIGKWLDKPYYDP
jgi:hypothetical protein